MTLKESRPIRILMIGPDLSLKGGIASVTRVLRDQSRADRGVKIHIVPTVKTTKKILYPLDYVRFLICFLYQITTRKFDLVHIHLSSGGSFYRKLGAMTLLNLFHKPYIVHLHSGKFDIFYENAPSNISRQIKRNLDKAVAVVVLSKSWERWIKTSIGIEKTVVISNGTESFLINGKDKSRSDFILFFGGQLEKSKGVDLLLEAFQSIQPLKKVSLWFAGDGHVDHYEKRAIQQGLHSKTEFFGWLSKEDYRSKLNQADLFVLPSYAEGMPMSIIEAMSVGLPIVSTTVGGIPELVQTGKNGMLVPPGSVDCLAQALNELIHQPDTVLSYGQKSRCVFEAGFSADRMYEKFRALYYTAVR